MSTEIEILPVTSSEVLRILGSLNMEQLEYFLDEVKNAEYETRIFKSRVKYPLDGLDVQGKDSSQHRVDSKHLLRKAVQ